jgi:hypothetical protein
MDVISSIVFGHLSWIFAEWYCYYIDVILFNIPVHKRFTNFITNCANCKYPINKFYYQSKNVLSAIEEE